MQTHSWFSVNTSLADGILAALQSCAYQKKVPTANAFIMCIDHVKDQLHSYPF